MRALLCLHEWEGADECRTAILLFANDNCPSDWISLGKAVQSVWKNFGEGTFSLSPMPDTDFDADRYEARD